MHVTGIFKRKEEICGMEWVRVEKAKKYNKLSINMVKSPQPKQEITTLNETSRSKYLMLIRNSL